MTKLKWYTCIAQVANPRAHGARCRNKAEVGFLCKTHAKAKKAETAPMPDRVLIKVNTNQRVTQELARLGLPIFVRTEKMEFRRTQERVGQAMRAGRSATTVRRSDQRYKRATVDSGCQVFGIESLADVSVTEIFRELQKAGYKPVKAHGLARTHRQPVRLVVEWARDRTPDEAMAEAQEALTAAKTAWRAVSKPYRRRSEQLVAEYRAWQDRTEREWQRAVSAWKNYGRKGQRPTKSRLHENLRERYRWAYGIEDLKCEFHRAEKTVTAHRVGQEIMFLVTAGRRESIGRFYREIIEVSFAQCDLYANPRSGENGEGPLVHTVNLGGERSPLDRAKYTLHFGRGLWGVNEFVP